jgi:hypothetical protein
MTKPMETAVALMRMALALLDRAGETEAAARLQHAIDRVKGAGGERGKGGSSN